MAGELLASQGHKIVLHARNAARAQETRKALPKAEGVVVGDPDTIAGAKDVAAQVNALGRFDAVMHNAAVDYRERYRITADGLPHVFAINTLTAYILTALIERPQRLVYLRSGMHRHADANLDDVRWKERRWHGSTAYAEGKLHDAMLAFAIGRRWTDVKFNALEPGWVPTKMGGSGARDDMDQAHLTQAWLGRRRRSQVACDRPILLSPQMHGPQSASARRGAARSSCGKPCRDIWSDFSGINRLRFKAERPPSTHICGEQRACFKPWGIS
jgi:NAD(P)-dependent dehydrogenase (short-subunit alcohol dehydrogenase family)